MIILINKNAEKKYYNFNTFDFKYYNDDSCNIKI